MSTKKSDELFSNQILDDLINLPKNWEVTITRDKMGNWDSKAEAWIDNGYGGRKTWCGATSISLVETIEVMLKQIKETTKVCGHRFH